MFRDIRSSSSSIFYRLSPPDVTDWIISSRSCSLVDFDYRCVLCCLLAVIRLQTAASGLSRWISGGLLSSLFSRWNEDNVEKFRGCSRVKKQQESLKPSQNTPQLLQSILTVKYSVSLTWSHDFYSKDMWSNETPCGSTKTESCHQEVETLSAILEYFSLQFITVIMFLINIMELQISERVL